MYTLGIDGGGSKTEAVIIDDNECVLGKGLAGGCNMNFVARGAAVAAFVDAIRQALEDAGLQATEIGRAGCTFGGAASDAFAEVGLTVAPLGIGECQVAFERAGFTRTYGIAMVAGTGSSCFGFGEDGRRFHSGGLGALLGDEGGGYDIGLRGIRRALLSRDGRLPPTALTEAVCDYLEVPNLGHVVTKLSGTRIQQPLIAGFAARVAEAASAGDEAAVEIITEAGKTLGELIAFVASRVFERDDEFPIALAGGVFKAGDLLIEPLEAVVAPRFPNAKFVIARMSPGEAVARLARRARVV